MTETHEEMTQDNAWFNRIVLDVLKDNDHKSGYRECNYLYLLNSLKDEVSEIEDALINQEDPADIVRECADVANFAMMIARKANWSKG